MYSLTYGRMVSIRTNAGVDLEAVFPGLCVVLSSVSLRMLTFRDVAQVLQRFTAGLREINTHTHTHTQTQTRHQKRDVQRPLYNVKHRLPS